MSAFSAVAAGQGQRSSAIARSGGPTGQGSSTGAFCDLEEGRISLLPTLGAMLRSDPWVSDYAFQGPGQQLVVPSETGQQVPITNDRLSREIRAVHDDLRFRELLGQVVMPVVRVTAKLEQVRVRTFPHTHCPPLRQPA
jgi:hypothetical protein